MQLLIGLEWIETKNARQSLAYSLHCAAVSPHIASIVAKHNRAADCCHLANADRPKQTLVLKNACCTQLTCVNSAGTGCSLFLPTYYLVAMAMSLDNSENEVQIDHLHPKRFQKIAKVGPVYPEILEVWGTISQKAEASATKLKVNFSLIWRVWNIPYIAQHRISENLLI